MRRRIRLALTPLTRATSLVIALALGGCTTQRDQLVRGQMAFEQNEHERTLGLLRALEPDATRLSLPEQAHYAYLRGMTDYRIGHRSDARHWLAIARADDDRSPGLLPADWRARMTEALEEMNGVVYGEGLAALATTRKPGEDSVPREAR